MMKQIPICELLAERNGSCLAVRRRLLRAASDWSFALVSALTFLAMMASSIAHAQASDFTTVYRYDSLGRQTGMILPDPDGAGPRRFKAMRTTYDGAGRQIKVEDGELSSWQDDSIKPAQWTGFARLSSVETTYDTAGRVAKVVTRDASDAIVGVTQYGYDSNGRELCMVQRMNPATFATPPADACSLSTVGAFGPDRITRNFYTARGEISSVRKGVGTPLEQAYVTKTFTANGNLQLSVDARGNTNYYEYDGHDRLKRWYFPSKTSPGSYSLTDFEEYGYDANNNRTTLRKRDGSVLTFRYDPLNRLEAKLIPSRADLTPSQTASIYFGYDNLDNQAIARFGSTTGDGVTSTFDRFGRAKTYSQRMLGSERTLTYAYDANGNRTEQQWFDGSKTLFGFDGLNRVTFVAQDTTATVNRQLTLAYNARGSRIALVAKPGQNVGTSFDNAGRPTDLNFDLAGTADDVRLSVQYTPASQISQQVMTNASYRWDEHENLTRGYTANGLNQYTSTTSGNRFCYDDNGNMTADGKVVFKYDVENRLVEARLQESPTICPTRTSGYGGALIARLDYNPLGHLVQTSGGSLGTVRYFHDAAGDLVAEFDANNTLLRRYLHGPAANDPLLHYEGLTLANPRWLHANFQGSIVAVTDSAGQAIAKNTYDEWGIPGSANLGRFQYTGQVWIPEIGMYHFKARNYSPTLGRFLQTDPVGYEDQQNLYAYAGNDPINAVDPDGKILDTFLDAVFIIADVAILAYDEIFNGGANRAENVFALGADAAAAAVPFATGAGVAVRAGGKVAGEAAQSGARAAEAGSRAAEDFVGSNDDLVTLYRAVGPDELADIQETSRFINKGSAEGKYFTSSAADASDYARQAVRSFGDAPYTTVQTQIRRSDLPEVVSVDGGIPAYVVPNDRLPGLTPIPLNYSVVPVR